MAYIKQLELKAIDFISNNKIDTKNITDMYIDCGSMYNKNKILYIEYGNDLISYQLDNEVSGYIIMAKLNGEF